MKRCMRGHAMTESNSLWYPHTSNGKLYAACRACNTLRKRLRYRSDPDYQKRERARCLANYHRRQNMAMAEPSPSNIEPNPLPLL